MRLLLVEDNERLRTLLSDALQGGGYGVDAVGSISDLMAFAATHAYDLIIIDLGLPDGDGLVALRELRGKGVSTAVLIITARGSVDERVTGLDAGADDYLSKPFNNSEFLARVRALLRRPADTTGPIVEIGNTTFYPNNLDVRCNGVPIDLRFSERRLLMLMMRRPGTLVQKSALEASLSDLGRDLSPNAVEALVSRTRKALTDCGSDVQIETVRGVGYILKGKSS